MTKTAETIGGMQNNIRSFRIDDELWAAAQMVATERGESVSDILRDALKRYVARNKAHLAAADEPKTVTYVRRLEKSEIKGHSDVGDQTLWAITPPIATYDGDTYRYVVASHNERFYSTGPETLIFPADADGRVVSFGEVMGERGKSADEIFADRGYTISK